MSALDPSGKPLVGFNYLINVTQSDNLQRVETPSVHAYANTFSSKREHQG